MSVEPVEAPEPAETPAEAPAEPRSRWAATAELVSGLAICAFGIWQSIAELPEGLADLRPSAHHGVALLGLFLAGRAIAELFLSMRRAGKLTTSDSRGARVRAWLTSARVETVTGLLVLLASLSRIADLGNVGAPTLWHWGLALSGLSLVSQVGYAAFEGFEQVNASNLPPWLGRLALWCAAPLFQAGMAGCILVLGVGEVLTAGPATGTVHGGHAVVLFACTRFNRPLRDFWRAFKLYREFRHVREASIDPTGI